MTDGGGNLLFGKNCMKMKEIGLEGVPSTLLGSATVMIKLSYTNVPLCIEGMNKIFLINQLNIHFTFWLLNMCGKLT